MLNAVMLRPYGYICLAPDAPNVHPAIALFLSRRPADIVCIGANFIRRLTRRRVSRRRNRFIAR